jgi:hypothetical protein
MLIKNGNWQRESGEGRSYGVMWAKYKRRVLLAMSSQMFAQLVCSLTFHHNSLRSLMTTRRTELTVRSNLCLDEPADLRVFKSSHTMRVSSQSPRSNVPYH